jgi:hypothetical protein
MDNFGTLWFIVIWTLLVVVTYVDCQSTYCGCSTCTIDKWNTMAGDYSCGDRITWVAQNDPTVGGSVSNACKLVSKEFNNVCGQWCNPEQCTGSTESVEPIVRQPSSNLYCFPPQSNRKRYDNVFRKFTMEVKESDGIICGPGDNRFRRDAVDYDSTNGLKLRFETVNGEWVGSEVRLVPADNTQFSYGTYAFTVSSVKWMRSDGSVRGRSLPPSLVLGLFTWDDTDNFAIRERYNKEVDIEISRWNDVTAPDGQFLVQPDGTVQKYRFYTGSNDSRNPGGNKVYQFTWLPNSIEWYTNTASGRKFTYTTQQAIAGGTEDLVQCLLSHNVEVRLNLWNMFGVQQPTNMNDGDKVEVVISNFVFTPSNKKGVNNGEPCTKNCQCLSQSCQGQVCR